ncbi:MAG TPA: M2 family metallopeptidase, partial [Terriglobales bacterium]|nr:M2 family metallopeptidase [Terriglobales bacterium]
MSFAKLPGLVISCLLIVSAGSAQASSPKTSPSAGKTQVRGTATLAEAEAFMKKAEDQIEDLSVRGSRAGWVQENFITDDTETISAQAQEQIIAVTTQLALEARRFEHVKMPPELARKFKLLKLSLVAPAPNNDKERKELTEIASRLDGEYGKGKYCKPEADGKQKCLSLNDLERTLATSTNPDELLDAWVGWHTISRPMRQRYARFVELSNAGARGLGFKDTGAMWRDNYDMTPEEFSAELDRLWQQVEPLYVSLHAYVRKQLIKNYGKVAE